MTNCSNIQLLEPDVPVSLDISADNHALQVEEGGVFALSVGVQEYPVVFAQEKLSPDYDFVENDITNETDGSPLSLSWDFTNRTALGYTVVFDALPDTVNYFFHWKVRVTEL